MERIHRWKSVIFYVPETNEWTYFLKFVMRDKKKQKKNVATKLKYKWYIKINVSINNNNFSNFIFSVKISVLTHLTQNTYKNKKHINCKYVNCLSAVSRVVTHKCD